MILTAHQVGYLPWAGLFAKAAKADLFVVLDDVQFESNGFNNRNSIKTAQGRQWLTVPVRHDNRQMLRHTKIDNNQPWVRKHARTIEQSYSKAPYFDMLADIVDYIQLPHPNLMHLNVALFRLCMRMCGIETPIVMSSDLNCPGSGYDRLIQMCKALEADSFLFGAHGGDYVDDSAFDDAGIGFEIFRYITPEYPQQYGPFLPNLSIVDVIANCGDRSIDVINGRVVK